MRKKNFKGRCEKRTLGKCKGVCKTYDKIQSAYADILQNDDDIIEIRCNVSVGEKYQKMYVPKWSSKAGHPILPTHSADALWEGIRNILKGLENTRKRFCCLVESVQQNRLLVF